jgi:SAM-dependent methyltransferase
MKINDKKFKPKSHEENRMFFEGDTLRARNNFKNNVSNNLFFLLKNRFEWMNNFIKNDDVGIEVGAGTGISKEFIKTKKFSVTDFADNEWLDQKMVDALNTKIEDESLDFVISSNMIHHVPYPILFFEEMFRILKPGGKLIIQEINCSYSMRFLLRLMRHEGYDFTINVFDRDLICTSPTDLWSANCAIPNLLFDEVNNFNRNIPYFKVLHTGFSEFFIFINSGGVISKTFFIPLPFLILKIVNSIDKLLCKISSTVFALQRQIVLEKR